MQSFTAHFDLGLTKDNCALLSSRLPLSDGWAFRAKVLDRDLVVSHDKTGHPA